MDYAARVDLIFKAIVSCGLPLLVLLFFGLRRQVAELRDDVRRLLLGRK